MFNHCQPTGRGRLHAIHHLPLFGYLFRLHRRRCCAEDLNFQDAVDWRHVCCRRPAADRNSTSACSKAFLHHRYGQLASRLHLSGSVLSTFRACLQVVPRAAPIREASCFYGSTFNAVAFTTWTLLYAVPRWQEDVYEPIFDSPQPSVTLAWQACTLYAVAVGVHSLSFWKSVYKLGTVPVAVSKGAQQAGCFVFAHIFFCHVDYKDLTARSRRKECMYWNHGDSAWTHSQKPIAFLLCTLGVVIYSCGKNPKNQPQRMLSLSSFGEVSRSSSSRMSP
ncbi:unnamed protein product [Polarella glacialis]|uniref:Uncharacterized protein n=1 Tax=Polarella glacialis TaxID=89957 RepID=A0A813EBY5_POLGL|nr:unnamed protein product [Polarella glacialis]